MILSESSQDPADLKGSFLPKGLVINNQLVVGKKQEHIGERHSLLVLVGDDRFVVQAAEESASSADILIVNPRYCSAQQPQVKAMGRSCTRPPLQVGIRRIPTRSHNVPDTELCGVDANFENAAQFLTRRSMSITTLGSVLRQKNSKLKLTPKKGTSCARSKSSVFGFANSAQTFLKARISSRVTDFAPPVV